MATFAIHSDELSRIGISVETAFGTAIADTGAFKEILCPKGVFIDPAVVITDLDQNRSSRVLNLDDLHTDNISGPVTLRIPELLVDRTTCADLLYAVTQNKTAEGITPFMKTYKFNASQPDFVNNEGFFFTLGWRGPVTAKHLKVTSCIIKELTLDIDKAGTGDATLVKFKDVVILGKKIAEASTFSGTWTAQGTNRYSAYDFSFKYNDATVLPFGRASIKLDNGAVASDTKDTDGTPKTFFLNPPRPGVLTVDAALWYNVDTTGTVQDMMADYRAGTSRLYSILNSIATATLDHFKLLFYGNIAEPPQSAENRQLKIPLKLICGNDGANDALVLTYADGVDQTP